MFRSLAFAALILSACTAPPSGGGGGGTPQGPQPVALIGSYTLIELNGRPVPAGVTLDLAGDGSFGGQAPCNRYFGGYSAGSDFSFGFSQIGATRAACPQLALEGAYLSALGTATQFRPGREGDTIAFLDASGTTVASYVRASSPGAHVDISGNWVITAAQVNGVLTPNPGPTSAGVTFTSATREFSANLGCNNASGPYTRNGNSIDFGAIAVTTRQCFAPAPLEGPLLAAFNLVQTIVQTPTGIDLTDAAGQPLIRLTR